MIKAFIEEPETPQVQTLLDSIADDDPPPLYVPEFCLLECANILWKQIRFAGIPASQMQTALDNLLSAPLTIEPVPALLPRALTIGLESGLPIYDSLYIVLAESLRHPLITMDERQARAAAAALKPLSDFAEYHA